MSSSKRVFVTGGTGFVGRGVLRCLRKSYEDIVALTRSKKEATCNNLRYVTSDLSNPENYKKYLTKNTTVVHIAGLLGGTEDELWNTNYYGTKKIIEASKQENIRKFINISTIYAHPDVKPTKSDQYIKSKAAAYQLVSQSDILSVSLFPTIIIGGGDRNLRLYRHIRLVNSNKILFPPIIPNKKFNFVHKKTVINTIVKTIKSNLTNEIILSGLNTPAQEFYKMIAKELTTTSIVLPAHNLFQKHIIARALDYGHNKKVFPIDGQRSRPEYCGWVPSRYEESAPVEHIGLKQGVCDLVDWYEVRGLI